jgi:hypothetical protein
LGPIFPKLPGRTDQGQPDTNSGDGDGDDGVVVTFNKLYRTASVQRKHCFYCQFSKQVTRDQCYDFQTIFARKI